MTTLREKYQRLVHQVYKWVPCMAALWLLCVLVSPVQALMDWFIASAVTGYEDGHTGAVKWLYAPGTINYSDSHSFTYSQKEYSASHDCTITLKTVRQDSTGGFLRPEITMSGFVDGGAQVGAMGSIKYFFELKGKPNPYIQNFSPEVLYRYFPYGIPIMIVGYVKGQVDGQPFSDSLGRLHYSAYPLMSFYVSVGMADPIYGGVSNATQLYNRTLSAQNFLLTEEAFGLSEYYIKPNQDYAISMALNYHIDGYADDYFGNQHMGNYMGTIDPTITIAPWAGFWVDNYTKYVYATEIFNIEYPGLVVPVPSSILFFGSGLLGLAGWRRFRKS
jgi:hypothetical protein